ncbi:MULTISPECIES: hypothetical protein [Streptomyces]|nr:hypothetical protein [Streptomyces ruber]
MPGAQPAVIPGAPHGLDVPHTEGFGQALLGFLDELDRPTDRLTA